MAFCPHCAQPVDPAATACSRCGGSLVMAVPPPLGSMPGHPLLPRRAKTNGLAIAGFIFSFLCGIAGLPMSIIAYLQCRKSRGALAGQGLALAGIIISSVTLLLGVIGVTGEKSKGGPAQVTSVQHVREDSPTAAQQGAPPALPAAPPTQAPAAPAPPQPPVDPEEAKRREAKETFLYAQNAETQKNLRRAVDLYEKACTGGITEACAQAAYLYEEGKGVSRNHKRALALNTTACDAGSPNACNNLAVLYGNGKAGPRDLDQSLALFEKSCKLGNQVACKNVESARWDVAVDASRLWRDYNANEVAADNKYGGHEILVQGTVQSIEKDFMNSVILELRSSNQFMPTRAYLNSADVTQAARMSKGQRVLLTCTCKGKVVGSPVLKSCSIAGVQNQRRSDDDDE